MMEQLHYTQKSLMRATTLKKMGAFKRESLEESHINSQAFLKFSQKDKE